jgi:hypothetical protein
MIQSRFLSCQIWLLNLFRKKPKLPKHDILQDYQKVYKENSLPVKAPTVGQYVTGINNAPLLCSGVYNCSFATGVMYPISGIRHPQEK